MVAIRVGDKIFAPADKDYGHVDKVFPKKDKARIDFVLGGLFGPPVVRSRAILLQRFSSINKHIVYDQNSGNLFWRNTIYSHPIRSYRYPSHAGHFYYRSIVHYRSYDGGPNVPGRREEELIGVSLSGKLIYRGVDKMFLPEDAVPGIEELYQDEVDITEVIPEFYKEN